MIKVTCLNHLSSLYRLKIDHFSRIKKMRMTKEMYESLQVKDLKAIAVSRGLEVGTRPRKDTLVEKLLKLDEEEDRQVLEERAKAKEVEEEKEVEQTEQVPEKALAKEEHHTEEVSNSEKSASVDDTRTKEAKPRAKRRSSRRKTSVKEKEGEIRKEEKVREEKVREEKVKENPIPAVNEAGVVSATSSRSEEESSSSDLDSESTEVSPVGSSSVADRYARRGLVRPDQQIVHKNDINPDLDSGEVAHGILEVMNDGFGFIRSSNYLPGENDVYVAPSQIRRFSLKTGDIVEGNIRIRSQNEKFSALLYVKSVNGMDPEETKKRFNFEDMTPIFPEERIRLEKPGASIAMRVMDLMCPVGKGQRGMIVSPPKAGKTTLLKEVAKSVKYNNPEIHLIILLIDERPEEVTDLREALEGPNVEVIYSTFDELPEHHKRVAEMVIERAKRLVEHKEDVMILLDSITRLTRAYNLTEPSSGRTLSGGLDPVALHMPKRFFGAARNMREGGSLTILATALTETGSKMDDVVYEEFKGTGNMEMILNRKLSERRIFPAVDLVKSGTRRDDLLLTPDEQDCVATIRRSFIGARGEEATDSVLELFSKTRTNGEFVSMVKKHMWSFS